MTLTMQSASLKNINVTLVSINRKDSKSDGVAIFRGTDMNENLLSVRSGTIAINMNSYTGISVPESAIHQDTITITTEDKNGKEKEVSKKFQAFMFSMETKSISKRLYRSIQIAVS